MKTTVKRIIVSVLLICITFVAMGFTDSILVIKRSDGVTPMKQLYGQERNSIDVLILGSSHAGMNLDTATLWQEHGIASFALWGSVQPFWNSYHFLIEALKTQEPQVVVLDVYAATFGRNYSDASRQVTNVCGMNYSLNRFQAAMASAKFGEKLDLFLGLPKYHSRYSEVSKNDFAYFPWTAELETMKGTGSRYGVGEYELADVHNITEEKNISEKEEKYLIKIIELCEKKSIPLVLIKTPSVERAGQQPYYNSVQRIADEYNIKFINFNLLDSETGLIKEDIWKDGHLNTNGVRKTTKYLGDWLVQNYEIQNRKNDPHYESWNVSTRNVLNKYLHSITGNNDYFKEIKSRDLTVIAIKNKDCELLPAYGEVDNFMKSIGLNESQLSSEHGVWYIEDISNAVPQLRELDKDKTEFKIENLTFLVDILEDNVEIKVNGNTDYTVDGEGIAFIVYDKTMNEIVDKVSFLQEKSFEITR